MTVKTHMTRFVSPCVTVRFFPFSLSCDTFKSDLLKGLNDLKRKLTLGIGSLIAFVIWTILILFVDVQAVEPNRSRVGLATFNTWFHQLTGVHMTLYTVTDWLGLVPYACALAVWGSVSSSKEEACSRSIGTSCCWAAITFW